MRLVFKFGTGMTRLGWSLPPYLTGRFVYTTRLRGALSVVCEKRRLDEKGATR